MKITTLSLLSISLLSAQTFSVNPMFEKNFNSYKNLEVISTGGVVESFNNLKDKKSNFSLVRGDILFLAHNKATNVIEKKSQEKELEFAWSDYAIVGKIKERSHLYFIGKEGTNILTMSDFRKKTISIGKVKDMANRYLLESLIKEIAFQIEFKSYSLKESLSKLEEGNIDLLFAFGSTSFEQELKLHTSLVSLEIPEEVKKTLLTNKAFIETSKGIEVENYIVVSKTVDDSSLQATIAELDSKRVLLKEVEPKFGMIYSALPEILSNIREDKGKHYKTTELVSEISKVYTKLKETIREVHHKVNKIKDDSNQFSKPSQRESFRAKSDNLISSVQLEEEKLKLSSSDFKKWTKEHNVDELMRLKSELHSVTISVLSYRIDATRIQRDLKTKLLEEIENEQEREKEEQKEEERKAEQAQEREMMMNMMNSSKSENEY